MAITFITGVSGSGKSYFSVYTIYNMFKNELKKVNIFIQWFRYFIRPLKPKYLYTTVYTNINQFNFDYHPNLKELDFNLLVKHLTKLRHLSVNKGYTDKELIIEAKKFDLYNVLIVLDEAQDYLTKKNDDVLLWWLTYHRHLHQDIHILTQHLDQLSKDYLKNGIHFYRMPPPSMAIFSNRFTVGYYSCVGMTQKCREKSFTIPYNSDVGQLYVSGDKTERKSILIKYFLIFPLLVFFIVLSWWYFDSTRKELSDIDDIQSSSIETQEEKNIATNGIAIQDKKYSISELSNTSLITFRCINQICKYKKNNLPIEFLIFLIENYDIPFSTSEKITSQYSVYTLLLEDELLSILDKSTSNSKDIHKPTNNEIKLF